MHYKRRKFFVRLVEVGLTTEFCWPNKGMVSQQHMILQLLTFSRCQIFMHNIIFVDFLRVFISISYFQGYFVADVLSQTQL